MQSHTVALPAREVLTKDSRRVESRLATCETNPNSDHMASACSRPDLRAFIIPLAMNAAVMHFCTVIFHLFFMFPR